MKSMYLNTVPKWVHARCIFCGKDYEYPENTLYMPKTCTSYDCTRHYLHHSVPYSMKEIYEPGPLNVIKLQDFH